MYHSELRTHRQSQHSTLNFIVSVEHPMLFVLNICPCSWNQSVSISQHSPLAMICTRLERSCRLEMNWRSGLWRPLCTSTTPTSDLRILQGNQPTTTTDDMLESWARHRAGDGDGNPNSWRWPRSSIHRTCHNTNGDCYLHHRSRRGVRRRPVEPRPSARGRRKGKGQGSSLPILSCAAILAADARSNGSQTIQGGRYLIYRPPLWSACGYNTFACFQKPALCHDGMGSDFREESELNHAK